MKITEVNDENYEQEILKSERPAIVYFSASWCKFCPVMTERFEKIVEEFKGNVKFGKVDVDKSRDFANKSNIRGVPCIILFKDGREIGRIVGVEEQQVLLQKIESHLGDYY
ncbi:thioredoxin family protein [Candidatus Woesearchaeota archaeon]|nr:thioredoxin family protein [Candidatus Woesearchaeota archaeon]